MAGLNYAQENNMAEPEPVPALILARIRRIAQYAADGHTTVNPQTILDVIAGKGKV